MAATSPKRIFLIDAMGFVFRAFYAPMERLRSPSGLPTKVPYVFANMLRKLSKDWSPDYVAVVFDLPGPTFRDALYDKYKAQRPPMPEDLSIQLPMVRRLCEAMRLAVVAREGYEADDVIGTLSRQAGERGLEVFIVTADKDMLQLVRDEVKGGGRIRVFNPGKGDLLADEKKVEELAGVPPQRVIDLMALMGDSIDNIPGAKGIGEKGARELIQKYGTAERALEHAAEVTSKRWREALQNSREMVLLSKKLAAIDTHAPLELDLAALEPAEPDAEALRGLYTDFGFTSMLRELAPPSRSGGFEAGPETKLATPQEFRKFVGQASGRQDVALWIEPLPAEGAEEDEDPGFGSRPGAVALALDAESAATVEVEGNEGVRNALDGWLQDDGRTKTVHDPKLVDLLIEMEGGIAGVRHAVRLYSYLLRPSTAKHDLEDVAVRHLNAAPLATAGEKAKWLARLGPQLRAEVERQGLLEVYERIDLPLAPVLARMERTGVRIDPKALEAMSRSLEREIAAREKEIYEMAGGAFNVNSPVQLAEVLFDKLKLPAPRKSAKTGARSTAADVLEELGAKHPLPKKILEYREAAKLKSTYVDALPRLVSPLDGRLHTRLSQTGTATGRLSSSSPNLQNVPTRSETGRQIRAAFVAEKGKVLLSADYSQIELRLLAHFSRDPVLVDAFQRGEDIHARTAELVFGVGPMAQTAEHRRSAKAVNFGIIYGLSAFGLAQQLGIERGEAAKFIAAYFERYSGVKEYLERHLEEVRKTGFTRTLFGRIRQIPEIQSPQGAMRALGERIALNTPLQGTAADLIKLAMIEIDRKLGGSKLGARMTLQVHDELLFEVPQAGLEELQGLVKEKMEGVHPLRVPLVVDVKAGPNWRDME